MKQFFFLSGLPRSGSTVLAAILNQNPSIYVSPTSGLMDLMGNTVATWENSPAISAAKQSDDEIYDMLRHLMEGKYKHIDKPIIIDKARGWPDPTIVKTMTKVLGTKPKIIATVRSVPDCAASFVRVVKPKSLDDFISASAPIKHLKESYLALEAGYQHNPDCIHFVDYEDLLKNPKEVILKIYEFLELEPFEHDFNNIKGDVVKERDAEVWNIPGLHDIKPELKAQHNDNTREMLGYHYHKFVQWEFWRPDAPKFEDREITLLDQQFEASKRGDFELGWQLCQMLEAQEPQNHRAAFNRGFYLLRQGDLKGGMALLDRGRIERCYGDSAPVTPAPIWDCETPCKLLLNLEGGFGDQIYQARYAKEFAKKGCQVYLSCSPELMPLFQDLDGVTACVGHGASNYIYHEAWVPGMSSTLYLDMEYAQVKGYPYIPRLPRRDNKKFTIGLRWQGNAKFEHFHHKKFPPDLLFDAVRGIDANFICLQRDDGIEHRPSWVKEVPLNNWIETKDAISQCDLVISACTSVAHLSAAMGVDTWIVTPIMPYYLWALPGRFTPYYDSAILFRQEVYGEWEAPFKQIENKLKEKFNDRVCSN